jgi:RNA polymerase sigma factor (sigma-70 family)
MIELEAHRRFLWGLCYRMTGVAADADELVQETYLRALGKPPLHEQGAKPWLTQVAMNLARDRLRQRKREGYVGPWLPSPIELEAPSEPSVPSAGARYEQLESVGIGFLLTLEALNPNERAVLLLRDVFDHSVAETAQALEISEANVKTTLHRARKAMTTYDARRVPFTAEIQQRTKAALESFFGAIAMGETQTMTDLLRADVRSYSDGGGQFFAAQKVVEGPTRVILLHRRLLELRGMPANLEERALNGMPAYLVTFAQARPKEAPRAVMSGAIDATGKLISLFSTLAEAKLTHVPF